MKLKIRYGTLMLSQTKKHAMGRFRYSLFSLMTFTLASLLFLFCSSVKVYANDTFNCPAGEAMNYFSYDGSNISASCIPISGLGSSSGTCGDQWAAAPQGSSEPNCNKCMAYATTQPWWVDVVCPPGQFATGARTDSSTGCRTHGLVLYCAPLPAGWTVGGSLLQVLTGIHSESGGGGSGVDTYTYSPSYIYIQPPATCNNDNACGSGENCGNCPDDCCPPTCTLLASPPNGPNPTNVTYTWTSTYADDMTYSCNFPPPGGGPIPANGSASFSVSTSGSCTVTASNSVSSASCTKSFTVNAATCNGDGDCTDPGESCPVCGAGSGDNCCASGVPSCTLTFTPPSGSNTTNVIYNWTQTDDADNVSPYSCTNGASGTLSGNNPSGAAFSFTPGGSLTCTMTVVNSSSQSNTCSATFTIGAPPPSCTLTFTPTSGTNTTNVIYNWTQTGDADNVSPYSCTNGASGTLSGNNPSGAAFSFIPGGSLTCTLTVVNPSSQANTCSATFSVGGPPPVCNGNGVCDAGESCALCPAGDNCCPPPPVCNNNGTCNAGETCGNCPNDCCPPPPTCTITLNPNSGPIGQSVTFNWTQFNDQDNVIPMTCTNGGPNTPLTGLSGAGSFSATGTGSCMLTVSNITATNICSANFTAICNGPFTFVPPGWVDDPLYDGTAILPFTPTKIRTVHFTQMRDRINTLRVDAALPVFNWAGCGFSAGNNLPISTKLINCPRQALLEVYTACGQNPSGIPGVVTENSPIRKEHIEDLRTAIDLAK